MQYIKECLQLLYWIYFKPYTLKRHVQEICPEITDPYKDKFYERSAAAKANRRLKRYDGQGWWLTVLVPITVTFLCALLVEVSTSLFAGPGILLFNWWDTCLFFCFAWLPGQLIVRATRKYLDIKAVWLVIGIGVAAGMLAGFLWLLRVKYSLLFFLIRYLAVVIFLAAAVIRLGMTASSFGMEGSISSTISFGVFVGMLIATSVKTDEAFTFSIEGSVVFAVVVSATMSVLFEFERENRILVRVVGIFLGVLLGAMFGGLLWIWQGAVVGATFGSAFGISFILGVLRFYFWLPELLWILFLKIIPISTVRCLSWLPPRFDQLIYLPLPFMSGFIAEAYQENQTAARSTIDYLITSTNQQYVALWAIFLIAAEECRRCRTARDISAIRDQLNWISDQEAAGLTICLDISQDVTAALEASSPYRKAQQMDKVIQRIEQQRSALAAASAREATAYGGVLDSWHGILETASKTLREQAARSDEIPQVYLAGPALDPNKAGPLFKGRCDLFRQIETLTLSAQHPTLIMHGGRRSGKTSTLNYLPKWLPSDILPLLIDGQSLAATSTLSGFAEEFADLISKSARKVHSLKLPALASVTTSNDPFVTLRRWLDAVEEAVPDKTLLLCLDEFERLDEIVRSTDSRAPLNFLRHLIQHRERWTLLFTGVLTPEELPAYWSDYLINCETLRVSYLAEDDCLELIQHPVEDFPDIYPSPVAHAIRDLTGGQPYFTQLLCHELVEQLNRKKAKTVQMDDLQTVLPAVFERGYQVFREFWQSLTDPQRALLLAVAEAKTPSEEVMRAAPILVRKEILAQQNGGWYFRVPLLRRWLVEGQGGLS